MTDLILVLACAYITYHFAAIVRHVAAVDIFRLIREDFKGRGGRPPRPARTVADCVEVR